MFRRPRPDEVEERPSFNKGERIGSAIAHATPLLVGVPMIPLLGNLGMALLPCPIIAYVIARGFRRNQAAWGAFQGMQAAIVQLILVALVLAAGSMQGTTLAESTPQIPMAIFVCAFLLFLYTLWAAWDTAWGYDFRYIFISNFVDRITDANLRRQDQRRRRNNPIDRTDTSDGPDGPDDPPPGPTR